MPTSIGDFWEIVLSLQRGLGFSGSASRGWKPKMRKCRSKNEANMADILASIFDRFYWIWGSILIGKNRSKIDAKRHQQKRWRKEGQPDRQKVATRREPRGGVQPLPQGEERVVGRISPLNHLSPEGWWDSVVFSALELGSGKFS